MAEPFRMALRAEPDDIDANGHVNNAVAVRWLQEVATAHWYAVAPPADVARWFWVISRHEIDYLRASHLGETLEAETWGENPRGARFDRCTVLRGPEGDERVKARTTWVLMDRLLARPARVPKAMMGLFARG
ncbi:MAG: acyl-CoA thioesterase [Sandaracinobacteroides sp.]